MKNITIEQLNEILENHKKWLNKEDGGMKADLRGLNLSEANLRGVDLRCVNLSEADLRGADLTKTDLREADLTKTDLRGADLTKTDLRGVDLTKTDLRGADLSEANLRYANLRHADLNYADLKYADLAYADLEYTKLHDLYFINTNLTRANLINADIKNVYYDENTSFFALQCPEKGSFIGYKKADDKIVELLITEDSLRSSATSRKCRCSKAKVLSITNIENTEEFNEVRSNFNRSFIYKVGEIVEVEDFDEYRWNECSTGIHFFITRQEAVNY